VIQEIHAATQIEFFFHISYLFELVHKENIQNKHRMELLCEFILSSKRKSFCLSFESHSDGKDILS